MGVARIPEHLTVRSTIGLIRVLDDSSGIIFLVLFIATKETLVPLANDPIM